MKKLLFCLFALFLLVSCSQQKEVVQDTTDPTSEKQTEQTESDSTKKEDLEENSESEADKPKEKREPVVVKGLYLSGHSVELSSRWEHTLDLLDETELNSLVIDVKEDDGFVTYDSNVPLANELESDGRTFIRDIEAKMKELKERDIYTIARVVVFKDPYLAKTRNDLAMKKKDGSLYYSGGVPWVDPYKKETWDYVIDISKEAAELGFDEIQFDYVRFPENGKAVDQIVSFDNPDGKSKAENIAEFLAYAKKELEPYGVYTSADVFGLVTSVEDDMGIGQKWDLVSPVVDYISPMTYPSHYGPGVYGFSVPDANPYGVIKKAMEDAIEKDRLLEEVGKETATIRPWYQDFTATWVNGHIRYGAHEVKEQIRAAKELGIEEYLIWSPSNTYSEGAWR